jgi:hypothetical protein
VSAREQRKAECVGVLLDHRLDNLLGRLMQAGVDDFESRVAQSPSDHLRAPIVAVETGFGDYDSIRTLHREFSIEPLERALFQGPEGTHE